MNHRSRRAEFEADAAGGGRTTRTDRGRRPRDCREFDADATGGGRTTRTDRDRRARDCREFDSGRRRLAPAAALGALTLSIVLGAACKGNSEIGFEISLPKNVAANTAWFEVGAYRDASCASVGAMLPNGVPEGATTRVAFRKTDATRPKIGSLPNARYAFAAVARDENCGVIATGCRTLDVGDVDKIDISMKATAGPSGTCTTGSVCEAAKCVPARDNSTPNTGAKCSLELVGAGPLLNFTNGEGTIMSAPAIAATSTGFVIVYREIDPSGASPHLIILPIDNGGGSLDAASPGLVNHCATVDETDGIGLVMTGDAGMIAFARGTCNAKPALELLNFTMTNDGGCSGPTLGKYVVSESPTGVKVSLGPVRASALRPGGGLVVFTEGGVARIAHMDPAQGIVGPNGSFGGTSGINGAWIAATDDLIGLLAASTQGSDPTVDSGTSVGGPELRLRVLRSDTAIETLDAAKDHRPSAFRANGDRSRRSPTASWSSAVGVTRTAPSPIELSCRTRPPPSSSARSRLQKPAR